MQKKFSTALFLSKLPQKYSLAPPNKAISRRKDCIRQTLPVPSLIPSYASREYCLKGEPAKLVEVILVVVHVVVHVGRRQAPLLPLMLGHRMPYPPTRRMARHVRKSQGGGQLRGNKFAILKLGPTAKNDFTKANFATSQGGANDKGDHLPLGGVS